MAYDEALATRVRQLLHPTSNVTERKMFGGLAFMVDGHMACGVLADELMVRVGPDAYGTSLELPHARQMDFTGKAMRGLVMVGAEGVASQEHLRSWLTRGVAFVSTLPPK